MEQRLKQIRESERISHTQMYSNEELYKEGSWLKKPIKTITDILPYFERYQALNVLDLGCGVGRNCIEIARKYQEICKIDCVDILELAIEKLNWNAKMYGVQENICGIVQPIEDYQMKENYYDFVIAVSALEHIDTKESFVEKLREIKRGIRANGIVCLVINSSVVEHDKLTGEELPAQFEINLETEELQKLLQRIFGYWKILKFTIQKQQYDIPRENCISDLKTRVVTLVARK